MKVHYFIRSTTVLGILAISLLAVYSLYFPETFKHAVVLILPSSTNHNETGVTIENKDSSSFPETQLGNLLNKSNEQTVKGSTNVLLLGYMRGGTTFLGRLLGYLDSSFYTYEPLWKSAKLKYFTNDSVCLMKTPYCRKSPEEVEKKLDVLQKIFECNFTVRQISPAGKMKVGPSWDTYRKCAASGRTDCEGVLMKSCALLPFHVAKVLRLTIDNMEQFINYVPDLKVIFMARDPRGILLSRSKMNSFKFEDLGDGNMAQALCQRMKRDIVKGRELEKKYPLKIKSITYEQLANNPVKVVEDLYKFIHYKYSKQDLDVVYGLTHANSGHESATSTSRRNSSATALAWMSSSDSPIVKQANKYCSDVYELLQ